MRSLTKAIAGWGNFPIYSCGLYRPERLREELKILNDNNLKSVIPRGCGRAYGDAALNENGGVILQERFDHLLSFDESSAIIECESGVTFADLLSTFVPRGFFPPITPGTKFLTVGGAVAADIHGKNHHRDGSFANFVKSFEVLTGTAELVNCSRQTNSDLFWATLGGMGLTGVVTKVKFTLIRIPSAQVKVRYQKTANLDDTFRHFELSDAKYGYSVCWLDTVAKGSTLGRSVLMLGDFAPAAELTGIAGQNPHAYHHVKKAKVPFFLPPWTLNRLSVGLFNRLYYQHFPVEQEKLQGIDPYFYPLDAIENWNRGYGRQGFLQFQAVWPKQRSQSAVKRTLEEIQKRGANAFLAVLKTMGPSSGGWLSFPMPGYTLALDIPYRGEATQKLAQRLNEITLEEGGRVYLAKDAFLLPEQWRQMYPSWAKFRDLKSQWDPKGIFSSSLSRRLNIEVSR